MTIKAAKKMKSDHHRHLLAKSSSSEK